jgi:hypothetical protein
LCANSTAQGPIAKLARVLMMMMIIIIITTIITVIHNQLPNNPE